MAVANELQREKTSGWTFSPTLAAAAQLLLDREGSLVLQRLPNVAQPLQTHQDSQPLLLLYRL